MNATQARALVTRAVQGNPAISILQYVRRSIAISARSGQPETIFKLWEFPFKATDFKDQFEVWKVLEGEGYRILRSAPGEPWQTVIVNWQ